MNKITDRPLRIPSLKAPANDQHANPSHGRGEPFRGARSVSVTAQSIGAVVAAEERTREQAEQADYTRRKQADRVAFEQMYERYGRRELVQWIAEEDRASEAKTLGRF